MRKIKTIYEYFGTYTREQIDEMLTKLNEEEKEILKLRYGNDLNNPISTKLNKEQSNKFYNMLVPRMRRLLENPTKEGPIKTIYEYFEDYSKEQIDEMLTKLNENDQELLRLRYGDDLNKHVSTKLNRTLSAKFYNTLVPKMRRLLENSTKERENRIKNELSQTEQVNGDLISKTEPKIESKFTKIEMTREDSLKLLELLRAPSFTQMMSTLSVKEAVIIALKLGYIDGKCFSTESISSFLNIEPAEVIDVTRKVLLIYKDNINVFLDTMIDIATDDNKVLTLKKD